MPANLPPQYFEAERKFRNAREPADKIEALEEMLAIMPKHKGTDHLRADLRRRIAKLSQSMDKKLATQRSSTLIEKEGAAQVVVIGPANAGKSQLIAAVTSASPAVADYPFTTQQPLPGMMHFEDIKIQLIDTPPLIPESVEWWLPHMIRRADAMVIVLDLANRPREHMEAISNTLESKNIKLGTQKEAAQSPIFGQKTLVVGNKIDLAGARENFAALESRYGEQLPVVAISASNGLGLEDFKRRLYEVLDIIRVYTKAPGQKADLSDPITLKRGSTLETAAAAVHKDFLAKLKFARIWGSGKHDGIMAKRNHVLQDGDIIELHI